MAALPDLAVSWLKSSSVVLQPQLLPADTVWGQEGANAAHGAAGGAEGRREPSCHRASLVALSKEKKGFSAEN